MSGENEKEILRLVDRASDADDFARAILGAADDDGPKKDDLTKLSARLAAALPPGALGAGAAAAAGTKAAAGGAATAGASAAKAGFSLGVKGIIAVAVLSAGAGAIVARVATPERVVEVPQVPQIPPNPSIAPPPAIPPPNLGSPLPSASEEAPAPSASSTLIHPAPSAIVEPEATMLSRAHESLVSGDAQTALDLTTQHQRAYPHGVLSEERERIAIEALVRLGKRDQARARGAAFMKTYPQSTYRARIEGILGETHEAEPGNDVP